MIQERFERAFKTAIDRQGQNLFEQVRRVEDDVARRGLAYRNTAFTLLPRVTVLSSEQRDELSDVAERLINVLEKVIQIFAVDQVTRSYFLLKEHWEELAAIDPLYGRRIRISRFDTYLTRGPERFKVLENNTDCPAGVIFTGRVNEVLKKIPVFAAFLEELPPVRREMIDGPDAFCDELLSAYEEFRGRRQPVGVAVLQVRGKASVETQEMIKLFGQRGLPAVVCDPRDMRYVDGRLTSNGTAVDLVWNKINTADFVPLLEDFEPPEDYIRACSEHTICQVNSFAARFVTESKLCLAYLSDPAFGDRFTPSERTLIDRHIPWSRRLIGDPEVEFCGERYRLRELAVERREDLVLKAAYDIRGDGVTIGRSITQEEWRSLLERRWDRPFILQEFIPPPQLDVPCSDSPISYELRNFSVDLFMFGGHFAGFGSKLSGQLKVNVFQGGSKQALVSVVDPGSVSGRLLHVFTREQGQGNPAVVVRADHVDDEAFSKLARKFGAVTVFVLPSARVDVRLLVFSPAAEIGFCGHGILAGTYEYARDSGRRSFTIETRDSIVAVEASDSGLMEFRTTGTCVVRPAPMKVQEALSMIGLSAADFAGDAPFCVASLRRSPKLLVPIATLRALQNAKPQLDVIAALSKRHEFNGVFAYYLETMGSGADAHVRAFNPLFGVGEDTATSSAAGALAALLAAQRGTPASFRIEEGSDAIGRKSEMLVRVDERGVSIGGFVTPVCRVSQSVGVEP